MSDRPSTSLVLFREDLRLADNPALQAACSRGAPLTLLFVLDEVSEGIRPLGGAARWWLHHALAALAGDLARHGHRLILRRGRATEVVPSLIAETGADAVFWNRRYGAAERASDSALKARLKADQVAVESHQAGLLFEPWTLATGAGQPYRVFTPFWRACRERGEPRMPLPAPAVWPASAAAAASETLADWGLLPTRPDWAGGLRDSWTPGESGAQARLRDFLGHGLPHYATRRDRPDIDATSRLSPHLRFGAVSPFQLWHAASHAGRHDAVTASNIDKFLAELGWREFSWHLLFHFPTLPTRNFQQRFDDFPWSAPDEGQLAAWKQGRTGIPIVDAGMRQLWRTGWMHNRVRMIVASFLVKNLMIDWRVGEDWFWDTLVDADPASNAASWQWVAGSGADAAPYFRIFNPLLQAKKFDPDGAYVRRFVPEAGSGTAIDTQPIVDLGASRKRALAAFSQMGERD